MSKWAFSSSCHSHFGNCGPQLLFRGSQLLLHRKNRKGRGRNSMSVSMFLKNILMGSVCSSSVDISDMLSVFFSPIPFPSTPLEGQECDMT